MQKSEAVELLQAGRKETWNRYRDDNPDWCPDLSGERVTGNLEGFNLRKANICGTDFSGASFYSRLYSSYALAATKVNLSRARYDLRTKFPRGFDGAEAGAVFVSRPPRRSVFISYAWANEDVVMAIDTWLRRNGLDPRLDKRDFFAGDRIRDEIIRVMRECDNIVIFRSKESASKPWPQFESELAEDLQMAAKQDGRNPPRLIYVLLDDIGLPDVSQANRLAVVAKGRKFKDVCEDLLKGIVLQADQPVDVDLTVWLDRTL